MRDKEDLGETLNDEIKQHQREIAIKTLGDRTHLSIAKIAKLLEHPEHGPTIGSITLADLLAVSTNSGVASPKAAAPKAEKAPKAAKAPKAPKAPKAEKAAKAPGTKPRLNREVAHKEICAALKSLKGSVSNGDLVTATQYTPVQVRTFLNELIEAGKVVYEGKGRGTKYSLA